MDAKWEKKFEEIDEELRQLFESLKDFSDNQLNRSIPEGKWSILQNMHHLILSEGYGHKYLVKKLSFNPKLKNSNIGSFLRSTFLGFYMSTGIKRKAPLAVNTDELPNDTKFWETVKKWKEQRIALKTFLKELDPQLHKKQLYKHPFAGKMNTYQMLKFFLQHFRRHQKAINIIAKDLPKQIN